MKNKKIIIGAVALISIIGISGICYAMIGNQEQKKVAVDQKTEIKIELKEKEIQAVIGKELPLTEIIEKITLSLGSKLVSVEFSEGMVDQDKVVYNKSNVPNSSVLFNEIGEKELTLTAIDDIGTEEKVEVKIAVIDDYTKYVEGDVAVLIENEVDILKGVSYDKDKIKEITADTSDVDWKQAGSYKVMYNIVAKDNTRTTVTGIIKVVTKDEAQTLANGGTAVLTNDGVVKAEDGSTPEGSLVVSEKERKKAVENTTSNTSNKTNTGSSASTSSGNNTNTGKKNSGGSNTGKNKEASAHTHNWVAQTTTINHEATGHYETKVVQAAWDEPVYSSRTICNGCGGDITGNIDHVYECGPGSYSNKKIQVGTKHHEAVTKQVWVQDSAAWTETVTTGYKCSCGATK